MIETDEDIAVGTKVFKRTSKLEDLLSSIPGCVETVYIADDGKTEERDPLYSQSYHFDLVVLDLEYDEGLGAGRRAIVEEMDEDYLVIVDSDHTIPDNLLTLQRVLEANERLGGVAGAIVEPDTPAYYITGQFFQEVDGALHRGPFLNEDVDVQIVDGHPVIYFDFVANAAMFRRECLEEYSWDSSYVIGYEHVDFYIGHWRRTDWDFGVCPEVVFEHYPGGSTDYSENRNNDDKLSSSQSYFLNKWGYEADVTMGFRWVRGPPSSAWYYRGHMSEWQKAIVILVLDGPRHLLQKISHRIRTLL
ncbi:Glycosyltransferase involved in cell wall bisynthesis [Halobiforma haloterrestris]|uniref:Glycosyltransferase involved in cell wall bisynthesis n=1 Tax=Natronobacterium haloterrestre TaxID=148448 RepID=A0A1I1KGL5_NATHA|nr:glycosyltransferase family 2 protein [Halobiforma haloterrestris]SFC59966.1 Glycosyltransferase involved in cell wall bisynthesis [Halobiforma haloterrestris]